MAIVCGVPKENVLGPLLFLVYMNDMYKPTPKVCVHLFADDMCLFYSNISHKKMKIEVNISLDNTANWLKANKLRLNVKKSNLLFLTQEKTEGKNLLLSYLLMMMNNYHGLSTLK